MLRIRVLGELKLERDGERIEPPRREPARSLLGWLALHPGRHSRSNVAGILWPKVLDASARASLRTSLSVLRSAIGQEAIAAGRSHVGLADVWVDAHEFERLSAAGRVEEALALCRGELLAGLDDDWVLAARDEHRAARTELLGRLAGEASAQGRPAAALAFSRRRAALDPLDESAHRELLGRLAEAGDRAGALAAHERFAERLRRQLGVPPSPATREFVRALRIEPPGRRPSPPSRPPSLPPSLVAARRRRTFVGREAELGRLRDAWQRSERNGRGVAVVAGEPGIGKTRLAAELAAELREALVLYGAAEDEALVPYQPLVACLREAVGAVTASEEWRALAPLLPELGLGTAPSASLADSPAARLRLFEAAGSLLDAAANERPVLLVLDDLHWADRPTLRLLAHLARRPRGAPRLLLATYRDTDVRAGHPLLPALADLRRSLAVERVELGGLRAEAVGAMAGSRDHGDAEALRTRTGGNPFYVEQLLHGGGAEPGGVAELISARVHALGAQPRAFLEAAAVAGPQFEPLLVAEAAGMRDDDALDALDATVHARLVAEAPGDPARCTFVHAVVRETLAGSLTAARRTRLHEALATALERRAEDDPDRYLAPLAAHALDAAAGGWDPVRAAELAEQAARRAGVALAHEDAAELLSRALAALERRGAPAGRRGELACAAGEALTRAGLGHHARAAFAKARALALTADRPDLIARAALGAGGSGVTILGTDADLVAELERALTALGDRAGDLRARLLARLAIELAYDPDRARVEATGEAALAIARRTGDPAALAAALNARHVTLWGPDHTKSRLDLATEMLELARTAGDLELALQARNWRVVDLFELGDGPAVRDEIDAYSVLSADARLPAYAWYVPLWRATLALLDGRIADGLDLARRARERGRRAQDANAEVFFAEQLLLRALVDDRLAEIDAVALGVQDVVAPRAEHGPAWRAYRLTFAWIDAERGDLVAARRHYDAALAGGVDAIPQDANWLSALASAANAAVLIGDLERVPALRRRLEPYSDRMLVAARGAWHGGSVAYLLGRLLAACGDHAAAAAWFAEAAERDERAGATAFAQRDLRALRAPRP